MSRKKSGPRVFIGVAVVDSKLIGLYKLIASEKIVRIRVFSFLRDHHFVFEMEGTPRRRFATLYYTF